MGSHHLLYAMNTYHPKVQVHDWHLFLQACPKDNDPYDPPGGNQFLSTYNRMGTLSEKTPKTETRDMLEQIWTKEKYETIYPKRPLVNFVSYPTTDTPDRRAHAEEANFPQLPKDYGVMDYRSTMQRDYQPINPQPPKPPSIREWPSFVNRMLLTEFNDGTPFRRKGINKFFDDNTAELYKTKEMVQWRHSSYDPGVGKYTHEKCCNRKDTKC